MKYALSTLQAGKKITNSEDPYMVRLVTSRIIGSHCFFIRASPRENMSSDRRPKLDYGDAQFDQGLRCPLTESFDTMKCITKGNVLVILCACCACSKALFRLTLREREREREREISNEMTTSVRFRLSYDHLNWILSPLKLMIVQQKMHG